MFSHQGDAGPIVLERLLNYLPSNKRGTKWTSERAERYVSVHPGLWGLKMVRVGKEKLNTIKLLWEFIDNMHIHVYCML